MKLRNSKVVEQNMSDIESGSGAEETRLEERPEEESN